LKISQSLQLITSETPNPRLTSGFGQSQLLSAHSNFSFLLGLSSISYGNTHAEENTISKRDMEPIHGQLSLEHPTESELLFADNWLKTESMSALFQGHSANSNQLKRSAKQSTQISIPGLFRQTSAATLP